MSELRRCRRMIERPGWEPPRCLSVEIEYRADPIEIPYGEGEEPTGGVRVTSWHVVAVKGPLGMYHHPDYFLDSEAALLAEDGIIKELEQFCLEDYAIHRRG